VGEYLGRLVLMSPEWEPLQRELLHTARLVPVYPLTEGVGARWLRRLIKGIVDYWAPRIEDPLPSPILEAAGLEGLGAALSQMHFPGDDGALERARQRLCFDEFLLLQLGILSHRRAWRSQAAQPMQIPEHDVKAFVEQLPFKLTSAQDRAIAGILEDMQRPVPMSRLLQGDVGSGKTVVAVVAMLTAVRNGFQAAAMAPTAILAEQHYLTISRMLQGFPDIKCALLVGSLSASDRQRLHDEIAEGRIQVVIGTHALIQATTDFDQLGLVVVDEQHRFGVGQRTALRAKGTAFQPHLLAMSATPIPRTLALTIYGDLDISVLDELPPNRQRVVTAVRDKSGRERIYAFLEQQVKQGHQAFIICPLIEESDKLDAKAAVPEYEHLKQEVYPHLKVGLLHGRMGAEEKEQVMADFKARCYDILVSTAVVEVGIDVPNATVILVEGAERFGLAQLHQFRGRVGRGEAKSYCILLSDDPSPECLARLQIMEQTHDGFVLAEKDLEMRGPGDFFGERQSGLPMLKVARLGDTAILEKARTQAQRLFESDPELAAPEHQALASSVRRFWTIQDLS
jgi:ATP-dependent DNA helicase RecG